MSDHALEDVIELAVRQIAGSGKFTTQEKRDFLYSLFDIQTVGDCGFTHMRTIDEMVACGYTFLFNKTEMFDYGENRDFYDSPYFKGPYGNGCLYPYTDCDPSLGGLRTVCVDSGSEAWAAMVKIGAITGEGAKPVKRLDNRLVISTMGDLFKKDLKTDDWFARGVGSFIACALDGIFGTPEQAEYDAFLEAFYREYMPGF